MAAGVGRQSSAVINNRHFNCRVSCFSLFFSTFPPWWVDAQGASDRMLGLSSRWLVVPCGAAGPSERYGVVDSLGSMCVAHNCMGAQGKNEVSVHGVCGDGPQGNTSSNQATPSGIRVAHDVSCLPVPHVGPLAQVTLPHSRNW